MIKVRVKSRDKSGKYEKYRIQTEQNKWHKGNEADRTFSENNFAGYRIFQGLLAAERQIISMIGG